MTQVLGPTPSEAGQPSTERLSPAVDSESGPGAGRAPTLAQKFVRIAALRAAGEPVTEGDEDLALRGVGIGDLEGFGHRSCHRTALPYLFEAGSAVNSPWLSVAAEGRRYNFIGAHSYVNDGGYLRDEVVIWRYCSVGRRVTLGAGHHRMEGLSTSPALSGRRPEELRAAAEGAEAGGRRAGLTVIESDVWIGDGAVVMPGVRIAVGSVVGANAVVTRDTLPYGVYAGLPARLLRRRFPDEVCEALVEARWWDLPHEVLAALPVDEVREFFAGVERVEADYATMVVTSGG